MNEEAKQGGEPTGGGNFLVYWRSAFSLGPPDTVCQRGSRAGAPSNACLTALCLWHIRYSELCSANSYACFHLFLFTLFCMFAPLPRFIFSGGFLPVFTCAWSYACRLFTCRGKEVQVGRTGVLLLGQGGHLSQQEHNYLRQVCPLPLVTTGVCTCQDRCVWHENMHSKCVLCMVSLSFSFCMLHFAPFLILWGVT